MPQGHHGNVVKPRTNARRSHAGFILEPAEVCVVHREGILITDSVINGVWINGEVL